MRTIKMAELAPVRFATDIGVFMLDWVGKTSTPEVVHEKARNLIITIERIALTAAVFFLIRSTHINRGQDDCQSLGLLLAQYLPETRLGITAYLFELGFLQLTTYTHHRWNNIEAPAKWALYGICHVMFGAGGWHLYESYSRKQGQSGQENSWLYNGMYWTADHIAPLLTRVVTGETKAT